MADANLTVDEVVAATLKPRVNVEKVWPVVLEEMQVVGVASRLSQIGMAATVAVETLRFWPLKEILAEPTRQPKLYALQMKYWKSGFYGRGLIQTTHEVNYKAIRQAIQSRHGVDVVKTPDELLRVEVAATAAALFWSDKAVAPLCEEKDWQRVRRRVNGGLTAYGDFAVVLRRFGAIP